MLIEDFILNSFNSLGNRDFNTFGPIIIISVSFINNRFDTLEGECTNSIDFVSCKQLTVTFLGKFGTEIELLSFVIFEVYCTFVWSFVVVDGSVNVINAPT